MSRVTVMSVRFVNYQVFTFPHVISLLLEGDKPQKTQHWTLAQLCTTNTFLLAGVNFHTFLWDYSAHHRGCLVPLCFLCVLYRPLKHLDEVAVDQACINSVFIPPASSELPLRLKGWPSDDEFLRKACGPVPPSAVFFKYTLIEGIEQTKSKPSITDNIWRLLRLCFWSVCNLTCLPAVLATTDSLISSSLCFLANKLMGRCTWQWNGDTSKLHYFLR